MTKTYSKSWQVDFNTYTKEELAAYSEDISRQMIAIDTDTGRLHWFDQNGVYHISAAKTNSSTSDPTVTDDSASGYEELSVWLNSATPRFFWCADATVGAAVWKEMATQDDIDLLGSSISSLASTYSAAITNAVNLATTAATAAAAAQSTADTATTAAAAAQTTADDAATAAAAAQSTADTATTAATAAQAAVDSLALGEQTGSNIYVSTTGDDSTGDGSSTSPYATIAKAMEEVPEIITGDALWSIKIANGTYTEDLDIHANILSGALILDGYEQPTQYGSVSDTVSAVSSDYGYTKITATTGGFTADEYQGYHLKFTSGDLSGVSFPIFRNTTTEFYLPYPVSFIAAASDSFIIVQPGVIINAESTSRIRVTGDVYLGCFVAYNICFTGDSADSFYYSFYSNDNAMPIFIASTFYGDDSSSCFLYMETRSLNSFITLDVSASFSLATYASGPYGVWSYMASLYGFLHVANSRGATITSSDYDVSFDLSPYGILSGIICRGRVQIADGFIRYAMVGNLSVGESYRSHCTYCYVYQSDGSIYPYGIAIKDAVSFCLDETNFAGTITNAIFVRGTVSAYLEDNIDMSGLTCVYVFLVNRPLGRVLLIDNLGGAAGTTADIKFNIGSTTSALPASGAAVTDSLGTFITRI